MHNNSVTVHVHRSELANLAYSVWSGNVNLYRANDEIALKILIELHGQCSSTNHGERCVLFHGHSANTKHRWVNGSDGIYWSDAVKPVTWKDGF